MSHKRPGWRAAERTYNYLTRQLHREAEAERKAAPPPKPPFSPQLVIHRALASVSICPRCHKRPATFCTFDTNWSVICRQCITLDDRWFCGKFPCGLVYADRAIEEHGDYKRVAFLPYSTLVLEIDDYNSPLLDRVQADAAQMAARRGQPYQIAGNMTITLGERA